MTGPKINDLAAQSFGFLIKSIKSKPPGNNSIFFFIKVAAPTYSHSIACCFRLIQKLDLLRTEAHTKIPGFPGILNYQISKCFSEH